MARKQKLKAPAIEKKYLVFALRIMGDFGVSIAVPVVFFVIVGQWLDKRYNTSPWITVLAFVLAGLLSGKVIYRKAKEYGKEYQHMDKEK